jgi:hypothetical protein
MSADVVINIIATIDSTQVDITDYVLNVGDFPILLNNYDASILDCAMQMEVSNTILQAYPLFVSGINVEVKQNGVLLMPFYIKSMKEEAKDYIINAELEGIYMKLKAKIFQADWEFLLYDNVAKEDNVTLGTAGTAVTTLYKYENLLPYVFNYLTGYTLVVKPVADSLHLDGWIASDILWNFGQEYVSGLTTYRDKEKMATWLDLIQLLCYQNMLFGFTNGAFVLAHCSAESVVATKPTYSVTYEYNEETGLDLEKYIGTSYSELSPTQMYLYKASVSPYKWQVDLNETQTTQFEYSTKNGIDVDNFNCRPFVIYNEVGELRWCVHEVIYLLYSKTRFRKSRTTYTYLTNLINNLTTNSANDYFYSNINSCEFVWNDGIYLTKIEYRDAL